LGARASGTIKLGRLERLSTLRADARSTTHDPYAYLRDVMERLPTQPASRIEELLPLRELAVAIPLEFTRFIGDGLMRSRKGET